MGFGVGPPCTLSPRNMQIFMRCFSVIQERISLSASFTTKIEAAHPNSPSRIRTTGFPDSFSSTVLVPAGVKVCNSILAAIFDISKIKIFLLMSATQMLMNCLHCITHLLTTELHTPFNYCIIHTVLLSAHLHDSLLLYRQMQALKNKKNWKNYS